MNLITREELMNLPTTNYDKRAQKEFDEKIAELNGCLRTARSNNDKFATISIKCLTDAAIDMLTGACEKAGYQVTCDYNTEESCGTDSWMHVKF